MDALSAQLAIMLDIYNVVLLTYMMEGDRLELLRAYDMVEALRALCITQPTESPNPGQVRIHKNPLRQQRTSPLC
eukprot:COSAG02_NODE_22209_length_760_cov_0.821483_1_plen_75_part_00